MMDEEQRDKILSIIDNVNDMTIATVRDDGYPQATTVSFVHDGLTIYFMTTADSQKAQNIAKNNKVSLTINRDYKNNWDAIEGLSLGGIAIPVLDVNEQEQMGMALLKKFPQAEKYAKDFDVAPAFFRVEPQVISLLDYKKGFGHTETIEV